MLSPFHVLLADDDPALLDTIAAALTRIGADVVRAWNGADLIEQLAKAGPFDLVVTDIGMPWMSGLQAMHSIRSAGLPTPVIVMTALTDERIPAQVQALGEHALFLRKPFGLGQLESAVSLLLSATQPRAKAAGCP
jgi:two-component system cell cycle sensor histidine kinase/response regulator CckA